MAITKQVKITDEFITLGQFLKIADLIGSGGEAKLFLAEKEVKINNLIDNRRGRKLYKGDLIEISHKTYEIC